MGCCSGRMSSGEQYIRKVIQKIDLWETTYCEIKEKLILLSENYFISKQILKKEILDPLAKSEELQSIFNYILAQLTEKSSIYLIIFYLFPFLSHTSNASEFFEVMYQINAKHSFALEDLRILLLRYYSYIIIHITNQIQSAINLTIVDDERRKILKDIEILRLNVYKEDIIEHEVNMCIKAFKNRDHDLNTPLDFSKFADESLAFAAFDVREYYYLKYAEK